MDTETIKLSHMNIEVFAEACQRMASEGFPVATAQYDDRVFGSWFVELSEGLRLVWDGKEGWLSLEARRGDEWRDLWIGKDGEDQSLARALKELAAARE